MIAGGASLDIELPRLSWQPKSDAQMHLPGCGERPGTGTQELPCYTRGQ